MWSVHPYFTICVLFRLLFKIILLIPPVLFVAMLHSCYCKSGTFYAALLLALFQGCSQPHSPGWARVPLSLFFHHFLLIFPQTFFILSSFWHSGWASPGLYATALFALQEAKCAYIYIYIYIYIFCVWSHVRNFKIGNITEGKIQICKHESF